MSPDRGRSSNAEGFEREFSSRFSLKAIGESICISNDLALTHSGYNNGRKNRPSLLVVGIAQPHTNHDNYFTFRTDFKRNGPIKTQYLGPKYKITFEGISQPGGELEFIIESTNPIEIVKLPHGTHLKRTLQKRRLRIT